MNLNLVIHCDWSIVKSLQHTNTVGEANTVLKNSFGRAIAGVSGASELKDMTTTPQQQDTISGLFVVDVSVDEDLGHTVAATLAASLGQLWIEFVRTCWSSSGTIVFRLNYKHNSGKKQLKIYPRN